LVVFIRLSGPGRALNSDERNQGHRLQGQQLDQLIVVTTREFWTAAIRLPARWPTGGLVKLRAHSCLLFSANPAGLWRQRRLRLDPSREVS
jgi:hypothetical protein